LSDIAGFVSQNRFSDFHNYSIEEITSITEFSPLAVLVSDDQENTKLLSTFSEEFCASVRFGRATKAVAVQLGGVFAKRALPPFFGVVRSGCQYRFEGELNEAAVSEWLRATLAKERKCDGERQEGSMIFPALVVGFVFTGLAVAMAVWWWLRKPRKSE
jgi:hypothetical protein